VLKLAVSRARESPPTHTSTVAASCTHSRLADFQYRNPSAPTLNSTVLDSPTPSGEPLEAVALTDRTRGRTVPLTDV
jgi:hypothetical protein